MGLAQFILDNIEPILTEWEAFAKSMPPGQEMNSAALRDDAERMLRFVAADMDATQSEGQRAVKGRGEQAAGSDESAANAHGRLRLAQEFDLAQMVSEFRALRASVIRLWSAQPGATPSALSSELIRFNEAIDQILAESVSRYRADMDRARELLLAVLGHDLRNPLSSIRMSAEILARTSLTPRQSDLNDGIIRGSERMRVLLKLGKLQRRDEDAARNLLPVVSGTGQDLLDDSRDLGHSDQLLAITSRASAKARARCAPLGVIRHDEQNIRRSPSRTLQLFCRNPGNWGVLGVQAT